MANQTPSVGRVVHYVLNDGEHAPAVIVRVNADVTLLLFVMSAYSAANVQDVPQGTEPETWHWPEYVG